MSADPAFFERRQRIDMLCDAFEASWRAGQSPRIEAELEKIEGPSRPALLKELLLVEWELAEGRGAPIVAEAYVARFAGFESMIREMVRQRQPAPRMPDTIAHYKILKPLGAGGMGEVLLAEDRRLGRQVALKLLPLAWAEDRKRRQRFITEARAASALNHPNVCIIHEVGETADGRPYLTMEFLEGTTLDRRARVRPFTVGEVVDMAVQIADALDAAFTRGVVHRDLKPANIMINERGLVKVLDFGLAKVMGEQTPAVSEAATRPATQSGQILGTPNYMSPEQAAGRAIDPRSDLFSLGIVFYELLTGRLPFSGASFGETLQRIISAQPEAIARFNYEVPPELERIVRKLLEKDPARRYQSPADLLVDLRNLRRDLESPHPVRAQTRGTLDAMDEPALAVTQSASVVGLRDASDKTLVAELVADGDVLLNFAPVDNQPLFEGRNGWVSQLHRHLSVRMEQLSGERIKVARHPGFTGRPDTDLELQRHLAKVKAMVSVVSPPFVRSAGCVRELQEFCTTAEQSGGLWVENKPRLFKVMKTPVAPGEIPDPLSDLFSRLFGFEFFEQDPVTGRIREFDEAFGEAVKQRYHERLYDLAHEICQVLRILKQLRADVAGPAEVVRPRHVVYLALTTSELQTERDRIRRELLERGHMVLPEVPLPLSAKELQRVVTGHLEKCSTAIHLLGTNYGVTPEDCAESLPCLQVKLSASRARDNGLKRYLWMPSIASVTDSRQQQFLRQVQEDPQLQHSAEIIEGDLSLLKRELIRWLEPPKPKPLALPGNLQASRQGPAKVYLICEPRDEAEIEPLEDYLFAQGLEVSLPAFDGSDAEADALHRENLLTCDAAIVFFGAAPRAWVDIKLRELLKAAGSGRNTPIQPQGVYIAPPDDHRKERFRSLQARVFRQGTEFKPDAEIEGFVAELKKVSR
ncbi:MAG TPA: serine/threonine-protein kinase [Candidatus Limnocylindrales bacterium]|nr:serine/threonine-protein kinase [Candidatus Limnocylindrales bacterium]